MAQHWCECSDLLLQGRDCRHICVQPSGFPQEKEQIWFNILDHAIGTGILVKVRRQEECWKAISTYLFPALAPSAFFTLSFVLFLSLSQSLLHTASVVTSSPEIGREAGEEMGGEILWEPVAAFPSPCSKGIVQNKETQFVNVWILSVCKK